VSTPQRRTVRPPRTSPPRHGADGGGGLAAARKNAFAFKPAGVRQQQGGQWRAVWAAQCARASEQGLPQPGA